MHERVTRSRGCVSELLWNDREAYLVIQVVDKEYRHTPAEAVRMDVEWNAVAATSAGRIQLSQSAVVLHIHDGRVDRYAVDGVSRLRLVPFEADLLALYQSPSDVRHVGRWRAGEIVPAEATLAVRVADNLGVITDRVKVEGWQLNTEFSPGSFRGASRQVELTFAWGTATIAIEKVFEPGGGQFSHTTAIHYRIHASPGDLGQIVETIHTTFGNE